MNNIKFLALLASTVLLLTSCGNNAKPAETTTAAAEAATSAAETTAAAEETANPNAEGATMFADFSKDTSDVFEISDGWCNGDPFNVTWRKNMVTFDDSVMQLRIDEDPVGTKVPYAGAEYRTLGFYGYGKYEVSMKAIKNDGVVSSFFTYTGPSDNNPWDEIDVEILGKDTTKVQFNYYTNGRGGHEYMYDLGFDASEDFHTYAFEWSEDKIVWSVDGVEVYTAEEPADAKTKRLPVTPGKIMMNAWCGIGVDGWLNAFDASKLPLAAEYEWAKFTAAE